MRSLIFLKKNSFGQFAIININNGKFSFSDETNLHLLGDDEDRIKHNNFKKSVFEFYGLILKK